MARVPYSQGGANRAIAKPPSRPRIIALPQPHMGQRLVRSQARRTNWLCAGRRWRKALALDTVLPTPSGWTTMGDVKDGDILFDECGKPCRVVGVSPIYFGNQCAEVEFSDGAKIVADMGHLWLTHSKLERKSRRSDGSPIHQRNLQGPTVRTTAEIANTLLYSRSDGKTENNHTIPLSCPLECHSVDLPIPPYTLGAWLGDGTSASAIITCEDMEILENIERDGFFLTARKVRGAAQYSIRMGKSRKDSLQRKIRDINVLNNKHIPTIYQRASIEDRISLLQGLMDTDGWIDRKPARCRIGFVSQRLAEDVFDLILGLGFRAVMSNRPAKLNGRVVGTTYTVSFTAHRPVFRLPRKLERQKLDKNVLGRHRSIVAIRPVESVPVRCVEVDSSSNLYLASRWCIPTHNTTLCASIAVEYAAAGKRVNWGAPTFKNVEAGWEETMKACRFLIEDGVVQFNQQKMTAYFPQGGRISYISLQDPDNIRGATSELWILDECGHRQLAERAYYQVIRPTLIDTHGDFWGIGTPDGKTFFYKEVQYAMRGETADSIAWAAPTLGVDIQYDERGVGTLIRKPHPLENNSGSVTFEDLVEEFHKLPERTFRQEYMAEFLDDAGGVFRRVRNAVRPKHIAFKPYFSAHRYQMGVDIGRVNDFTVLSIIDTTTFEQVYFERFNKIDWPLIINRIARAANEYQCTTYLDASGIADHVPGELARRGVSVTTCKFTHQFKTNLIDHLASVIEHCKTPFLLDIERQTQELEDYQYEVTPSGKITMNAPKGEGHHDDCVIALALSVWGHRPVDNPGSIARAPFSLPPSAFANVTPGMGMW